MADCQVWQETDIADTLAVPPTTLKVRKTEPATTPWSSDAFLDVLRGSSDVDADECLAALPEEESLEFVFSTMRSDHDLPPVLPAPFLAYIQKPGGHDLSDLTPEDWERLKRGQRVFLTHALPMALALLGKSLPEGYQAPRLSRPLLMTGELERSTYRRVLGVLQMLVNINAPGSFERPASTERDGVVSQRQSEAALTSLRVRLMHAGIRQYATRTLTDFSSALGGVPVSLEDMMFTIMAFSLHVIQGVELLRIPLSQAEKDDYYFVWRVYARCMGIHPPGAPQSWDWIPSTLAEAQEFNLAYARRHYRSAAENVEGTRLAHAQARMIAQRLTGGKLSWIIMPMFVPRLYFERLLGLDACVNVGIEPVRGLVLTPWLVLNFPRAWATFWRLFDRLAGSDARHIQMTRNFFQRLVLWEYDGDASLRVVRDQEQVDDLVRGPQPGLEYGRQQFLQAVFPTELQELKRRREAVGLSASELQGAPSTARGLMGLALSGGGIRAASFALGAIQSLARKKVLRRVDYLSTVSGGGYTGSALSSVLTDPWATTEGRNFPFDFEQGMQEPPAVRHIRNGSNYLGGNDLLSELRLPTIILRGFLINGVLFIPYLMIAAWATWIAFPLATNEHLGTVIGYWTLGAFLVVMISYPAVSTLFGRHFKWPARDFYEKMQTLSFVAFALAVIGGLLSAPVTVALGSDWDTMLSVVRHEIASPFEAGDAWKWGLIVVTVTALLNAGKVSRGITKRANQLFILLLGALGPTLIFGVYLLLLVVFVRSPHLPLANTAGFEQLSGTTADTANAAARQSLARLVEDLRVRDVNLSPRARVLSLRTSARRAAVKGDSLWEIIDTSDQRHVVTMGDGRLELGNVEFGTQPSDWAFIISALLVFVLNGLWVDVNVSSAHGFYRDRLSKAFLFRARRFGRTRPNDDQKLSGLGVTNPGAPYHLINTAMNLKGEPLSELPGRRSDFFLFSKRFVGSFATSYCETEAMESADSALNLGTAMAISGAAAAPNSGTTTVRPLTFILTLLNVRLGYWIPNPWYARASSLVKRLRLRQRPGPNFLIREGLGLLNARTRFVNISDGGHIENLGIYELLRRRCAVIIAVDAECDPDMACPSLAKLTQYARTDLGLEINIEAPVRVKADGFVDAQWTVGTIHYTDAEIGHILYVKSSMTANEAPYVLEYKRVCSAFPHESTVNQFFDEAQFEAYRALGFSAMNRALRELSSVTASTPDAGLSGDGQRDSRLVLRDAFGFAPSEGVVSSSEARGA